MIEATEPNAFEGPPPHATSDEVIARLVVDELYWDSRVDASKVQVEVSDGVVVLTGHAPTSADRYAAEADARMIKGVVTVDNRIQVERPRHVPGAELAQNVSTVLAWTPDIDASDIEATASQGTVTLRGSVRLYWEKLRAHLLAARVEGVHHVVDELVITPSGSAVDHQIAADLTQALERRLLDEVRTVQVTVKNGVVTLRGSVPNAVMVRGAQQAAEQTRGVVGIHNELTFPHPAHESAERE